MGLSREIQIYVAAEFRLLTETPKQATAAKKTAKRAELSRRMERFNG